MFVGVWEGDDQVSKKGWAELGDGLTPPEVMGEGAIDPLLPPMFIGGWEGDDQVGKKGWTKFGDGLATPEKTGKGAINPCERPCDPFRGHFPPMLENGTKW